MSAENNEPLDYDLDEDLKILTKFLHLDTSKIQLVIDEFNKHGPNVSYDTIAELTGLDSESESINIRDSLASIIHCHIEHKRFFEQSLDMSKVDKKIIDDVRNLIKQLNERGLKGLDLLYSALGIEGPPTLESIDYNLMLSEILNDDGKQVGYLPLLRLKLELLNADGKELYQSIFMTLENFNALMKTLNDVHDKVLESVKNFRRELGDSVILVEK